MTGHADTSGVLRFMISGDQLKPDLRCYINLYRLRYSLHNYDTYKQYVKKLLIFCNTAHIIIVKCPCDGSVYGCIEVSIGIDIVGNIIGNAPEQ